MLHSHSLNAVLATLLDETAIEFRVTQLEMIKVPCLLIFHVPVMAFASLRAAARA